MQQAWLPLSGLRVVDFSMFVPGPFCSAMLADLGAEVIKVEPPKGDPGRGYVPVQFRTENRNKRSIALDLKSAASPAVVESSFPRRRSSSKGSGPASPSGSESISI